MKESFFEETIMSEAQQCLRRDNIQYENVESSYFENRKLGRSGDWALLWALESTRSLGDYFGWKFGLAAGGVDKFMPPDFDTLNNNSH
jgi:hypothetical protein